MYIDFTIRIATAPQTSHLHGTGGFLTEHGAQRSSFIGYRSAQATKCISTRIATVPVKESTL